MSIGDGIAIAGVWIFAGMLGLARLVTPIGFIIGVAIAGGVTIALIAGAF